jgi:lipopolysaccharide biosynthesis protein/GT2 family glycosyltransferase/CDP-glycerol glycerophosphotransferase (TagB/SpsB family)
MMTKAKIAIAVHIYYPELWDEISAYLSKINQPFDLFVTVTDEHQLEITSAIQAYFPNAIIKTVANQGMDILPFLSLIPELVEAKYQAVCKLHTKKGSAELGAMYQAVCKLHTKKGSAELGAIWRQALLHSLIGSDQTVELITSSFSGNHQVAMVGTGAFYLSAQKIRQTDNTIYLQQLYQQLNLTSLPNDWGFFAGSMFWVKPEILMPLSLVVNEHSNWFTTPSDTQQDGKIEHALERVFGLIPLQTKQLIGYLLPKTGSKQNYALHVINTVLEQKKIGQAYINPLLQQYQTLEQDRRLLLRTGLFSHSDYLKQFPDLSGIHADLPSHYLLIGRFQGATPHPDFDPIIYRQLHQQQLVNDEDCFLHYVHHGAVKNLLLRKTNEQQQMDIPSFRYRVLNTALINWSTEKYKQRNANKVSIIIPVFDQPKLTKGCIESLYQFTQPLERFEVVVVDNGSQAETQQLLQNFVKQYTNLTVLRNDENLNFALGCNLGFAASMGQQIIFLNNDTQVTANWLEPLLEPLAREDISAVQPRLLYPDGTVQCIGIVFSDKSALGYPIYQGMKPEEPWISKSREFQAVTGACMALRSSDFILLRGFDPVYINGQEDVDLCLRLSSRGTVYMRYASESIVTHVESKTLGRGKYINYNRKVFVKRWLGLINLDDEKYYSRDGFSIIDRKYDQENDLSIATYFPKLLYTPKFPTGLESNEKNIKKLGKNNYTLKIAIVLHVFHLDILPSIFDKINYIKINYDLIITVDKNRKARLSAFLEENNISAKLIVVENTGYDILPFIKCIPTIINNNYDLVCKLHTKKGLANLEKNYPDAGNVWLDMLLNPIMGSERTVAKIFDVFATDNDIGMLGSADFWLSAKTLMYGNDVDAASFLEALSHQRDPSKDWGFFGGSIFWARAEVLKPLISLLPILDISTREIAKTGSTSSIWHALERVFGFLSELTNKKVALAYSFDLDDSDIKVIDASESRIPNGAPYGVGAHIGGYLDLQKNINFLKNQPDFDKNFYLNTYGNIVESGFDPIYHYLRYGIYERCNPNSYFSSAWYWEENRDVSVARFNPLVHYLLHGKKTRRAIFPAEENIQLIVDTIERADVFDYKQYLANHDDVKRAKMNPLQHYCKFGWKEKREIGSNIHFDQIWYNDKYLRSWRCPINPLLHYVICWKKRNLTPRPQPNLIKFKTPCCVPKDKKLKRVCLFAGYDTHGIIDNYVLQLITELSVYADVYYMADGNLSPYELDKLKDLTKGAWAVRHGEYDFGSYSRLARFYVGWERIREYDELLLVNDSGYMLNGLGHVFDKMDKKACDWWGLQATKGISATKHISSNQFSEKIPFNRVLNDKLLEFEKDECYDFLVGSYFLAFRQPVLKAGGELQCLLDSVDKEYNKKNIILRYEVGLTRRLILAGHKPATFIDSLYPFHPIYTNYHFELLKEGYPLFKRFFLTENHYHVPELWRWKYMVRKILPDVDLRIAEANLLRIANADKLYKALNVPADGSKWPQALLNDKQFENEDAKTEPDDFCWAFPVCAYDHSFGGNERMVFEAVKNNPQVRKVILTRSKCVSVYGVNVEILPLKSLSGQKALIKSRYIFIKHTPRANAQYPLDTKKHRFINLWHGIPLKCIGYVSKDHFPILHKIAKVHSSCHSVIASSKIDRLAMSAGFYPLTYHDVWVTGLPRNDIIIREEKMLPLDFKNQLNYLRAVLKGRKLVLFAPTFRNTQEKGIYPFSSNEVEVLSECLMQNSAVLGIREHMADKAKSYTKCFSNANIPVLDLGRQYYPDIELLYREAVLLITDYSSCFIDFMLTGKPEISFAYDYDSYIEDERGLFYELEDVFPGAVCKNFPSMFEALEKALAGEKLESDELYQFKRKIFFSYLDDNNSNRVIKHIEKEIGAIDT